VVPQVVFYTRENCCLCDEALAVVESLRASEKFALEIVDVDTDEVLRARYGEKVPVVVVNGRMHAKYRVDARRFARRLQSTELS
jgi:glutaredoxin